MTLKNIFVLSLFTSALLGCVPKSSTTAVGTGSTTNTTASTGTGSASCSALNGHNTMNGCKAATFAQCFPSDKNIQGVTQTCYFAVSGSDACATNQASWSYGAWGNWCIPSGLPAGIYQRSRTATCTKSVPACDCVTTAANNDFCSIGNNFYPTCEFTSAPSVSCSTTPTPSVTPVPTATPSLTAPWCANIYLNYAATGSTEAGILRDLNGAHYGEISSYFRGKGYNVMFIRSASSTVTPFGPVTAAEMQRNYTVNIDASRSRCTFGNKVGIHVEVLQGNVAPAAAGYHMIAGRTSAYSACVHTGDVAGRMLTEALRNLNPPNCY